MAVLTIATYVIFGVVYWKLYPGRTHLRTAGAFTLVALVFTIASLVLSVLTGQLVMASLFLF